MYTRMLALILYMILQLMSTATRAASTMPVMIREQTRSISMIRLSVLRAGMRKGQAFSHLTALRTKEYGEPVRKILRVFICWIS